MRPLRLELEGFTVREAATVAEAEAALDDERPEVVLLDVNLGGEKTHDGANRESNSANARSAAHHRRIGGDPT